MRNKVSIAEYIAFLSIKYDVDPERLLDALVYAEKDLEAKCGGLSIRCRRRLQDKAVFLITNGDKVVAQFPISKEFLNSEGRTLNLEKANVIRRRLVERALSKKGRGQQLRIGELRTGMKQISLKAKVMRIAEPMVVFTKFGNNASVANALIADETGTIKLSLWNEQIDSLEVGDVIQVANARVSTFRNERQLRIGRNGTVKVVVGTSSE